MKQTSVMNYFSWECKLPPYLYAKLVFLQFVLFLFLFTSSLGELGSLVVSNSRRHQVSKLTHGKHGVWCSVRG